jgi:fatty-acyl-CoA synthase
VIGVPDPKWSERPLAFVVLKPGEIADAEAIRAHLAEFAGRSLISRYAVPEQVRFVDALPRTSVGKLNKRVLRESAAKA